MKIIILEYSSIPLFESFNGRNGKFIPLFECLSKREWNGYEGTLIFLYFLKISNFHSLEIEKNWGVGGDEIRFNEFFTKTPKIPLYIKHFILK